MRELTIPRDIWARGGREPEESGGTNYLLIGGQSSTDEPRKQCCIGVYLTACGVPDSALLKRHTAMGVDIDLMPGDAQWLYSAASEAGHLYGANDAEVGSEIADEADREFQIQQAFAREGVKVTFVDTLKEEVNA